MEEKKIIYEYTKNKKTLRMIARQFNTNHHKVKDILTKNNIIITQKNRIREPFTQEHKNKISLACKGRKGVWEGKKMPMHTRYLNMKHHLQWDVDVEWLEQFKDIERLKYLNKLLSRDRVSKNFNTEKYKEFIEKFYDNERFVKQFEIYITSKNRYDRPSLDHIIPLSRGGNWDLDNLQIISWFENRAKCDMTQQELDNMINKYWRK